VIDLCCCLHVLSQHAPVHLWQISVYPCISTPSIYPSVQNLFQLSNRRALYGVSISRRVHVTTDRIESLVRRCNSQRQRKLDSTKCRRCQLQQQQKHCSSISKVIIVSLSLFLSLSLSLPWRSTRLSLIVQAPSCIHRPVIITVSSLHCFDALRSACRPLSIPTTSLTSTDYVSACIDLLCRSAVPRGTGSNPVNGCRTVGWRQTLAVLRGGSRGGLRRLNKETMMIYDVQEVRIELPGSITHGILYYFHYDCFMLHIVALVC
jgi:hypothetical protein